MVICCDTSFLFSLYGNDVNSGHAVAWMSGCTRPLLLNVFTVFEFGNAIRFAEFRGALHPGGAARHLSLFEAAIDAGRLSIGNPNLAEVMQEAIRLSETRTLAGGHRTFDVLHVATALHCKAAEFLTFDANQKKLAEAEGLVVPL